MIDITHVIEYPPRQLVQGAGRKHTRESIMRFATGLALLVPKQAIERHVRRANVALRRWRRRRELHPEVRAGGTREGLSGGAGLRACVSRGEIALVLGLSRGDPRHGSLSESRDRERRIHPRIGANRRAVDDVEARVIEDLVVGVDHALILAGAHAAPA